MGITSSFISLALCATTSLIAFHSNSKEYITYSDQSVKAITSSVEQKKASQIEKLTKEMLLLLLLRHTKYFNIKKYFHKLYYPK
jgi:dihydroneopterin aldolase